VSTGALAAVHFALTDPERVRSLVIGSCRDGVQSAPPLRFEAAPEDEAKGAGDGIADLIIAEAAFAGALGQNGWQKPGDPATDSPAALRKGPAQRPSLSALTEKLAEITIPTLIITGDDDWACLEAALLLRRTIASASLAVVPDTGPALNLDDPAAFNAFVGAFFHSVETGAWQPRDPLLTAGDAGMA
jgi:pimeloyl-ACP methyl ester carboxylesterase